MSGTLVALLVGMGIVVAVNVVGITAELLGRDGNWWQNMADAFAVGVLCMGLFH